MVADFVTSYSKQAHQWNFVLRDLELIVQSQITRHARAYLILNAETPLAPTESASFFRHTEIVLEEAALVTTSLPWGLELKVGQFFADFSMLGKLHAHELPFVDRPPSLDAVLGGETLARGVELSWLAPTQPRLRFIAGVVDHIGHDTPATNRLYGGHSHHGGHHHSHDSATVFDDGSHRPFGSLTVYGRAVTLLELGRQTALHLGADYAWGDYGRHVASLDARLHWHPNPHDLFELGGEALWSQQSGQLSEEASGHHHDHGHHYHPARATTHAAGGYVYAQYRFGQHWQPGIRFDYTHLNGFELDEDEHSQRFTSRQLTTSAYLTYHISEVNRLRLQASYIHAGRHLLPRQGRAEWQVFFQWTIILGAHRHADHP